MSVLTPKRVFLVVAALLIASAAFASHPSPRTLARMVYDVDSGHSVLFGGRVGVDSASGLAYASDETWIFAGRRWVQRFPEHSPAARSAHSMAYDSKDDRVVVFGGRVESTVVNGIPSFVNDTWVWDGSDWSEVQTGDAPSARILGAMAYDPLRDRMVLYGGEKFAADGKTAEQTYDTWEFDGTSWTQVGVAGEPKVVRPLLAWDANRGQMIMLGLSSTATTLMYRYDPATSGWVELKPETLPPCVNDGVLLYRNRTGNLFFTGGICAVDNSTAVENYEWNGTNWTKLTSNDPGRATGLASAYDVARDQPVLFGGVVLGLLAPRATTLILNDTTWFASFVQQRPQARSLGAFRSDPDNQAIWLLGGLDEESSYYLGDMWRYAGNQWSPVTTTGAPTDCATPGAAYDLGRKVLVVVCGGQVVYEWDGIAWKTLDPKDEPKPRNFAGVVYDETLKKTVLFGGFDGTNFKNDTWTWDGTNWTEVKNDRPTHRSLMAYWYDPLMKKVVMFAGVGRPDIDSKVVRYNDMWSFNGTGWTKLNVSVTPGERFGPTTAVDPRTGKLLLFGGLRAQIEELEDIDRITQYYTNDMWEWNGASNTWTRLTPSQLPPPRENAMFAWDPVEAKLILFGGYRGGLYYSDVWAWDGTTWSPREGSIGKRRGISP